MLSSPHRVPGGSCELCEVTLVQHWFPAGGLCFFFLDYANWPGLASGFHNPETFHLPTGLRSIHKHFLTLFTCHAPNWVWGNKSYVGPGLLELTV